MRTNRLLVDEGIVTFGTYRGMHGLGERRKTGWQIGDVKIVRNSETLAGQL